MAVEFYIIDTSAGMRAVEGEWRALAERGGTGALFRGPDWLLPWWDAYSEVLGGELYVLVGRDGDRLICVAPFYKRAARLAPGLRVREVRLLGDAGPRPPALDLLVEAGYEERAGTALATELTNTAGDWDVIDLEPLRDPSRIRAFLANRLSTAGYHVESHETGGARRIALVAADVDLTIDIEPDGHASAYVDDEASLRKGIATLRRLSRLEWADREEVSPLADAHATRLIEEVTLSLGGEGHARLARLNDSANEAVAVALVVDDSDRAVALAMAVDPERSAAGVVSRLLAAEAKAAAERGRVALDVVTGAAEYPLPSLPVTRQRALNVRVFGHSPAAALARTYSRVRRSVDAARDAPGAAARAAWTKITTAAVNVAGYQRLHLYRGELWTRGISHTVGLSLGLFTEADFDALSDEERRNLVDRLELDETYARAKWQRGDMVVLARINDRPAGVAWCARGAVEVPELGRTLALGPSEAYIHDVFVGPHARGRSVAPSMLEFLAGELRQRDVYRCWALIGSDNLASVRAFEKAAYTAVAEVIYARMVDHIIVRPPDPEAKKMLGIS